MPHLPQLSIRFALVGLSLMTVAILGPANQSLAQYQGHEGDIVVIGNSPSDWSKYNGLWRQILQLNAPETSEDVAALESNGTDVEAQEADPKALEAKILKNLKVGALSIAPIVKLSGSSQLKGTISNNNKKPVTVSAVNFEIVDKKGNLVQSGSAAPQPSTIAPGQTVTFQKDMLGLAAESSYKVRLTNSPIVLQGGI